MTTLKGFGIQRLCPLCLHHLVMQGPVAACEACYFAFCLMWGDKGDREKCWLCQQAANEPGLLTCKPCAE